MSGTVTINYSVDIAPLINMIIADETRERGLKKNIGKVVWILILYTNICIQDRMTYLPNTTTDWNKFIKENKSLVENYIGCLVSHYREDKESDEYKQHFPTVRRIQVKVEMTEEHAKVYIYYRSHTY